MCDCTTPAYSHVASSCSCTTSARSIAGAVGLLGSSAHGAEPASSTSTSDMGESSCLQFPPAGAVLNSSWPSLYAPLTLEHGGWGVTAACTSNAHADREHCCQSARSSTSTAFLSMGSGFSPLLTWPSHAAESMKLPLHDINSSLLLFLNVKMPLSNWLATSSFSLLPGQGGQGSILTVLQRDTILSNLHLQLCNPSLFPPFGCRCPLDFNSCDSIPLLMSRFLFKSHNCQEGDTRGGLLQKGIRSDPWEYWVWPFDPGTLHREDQLFTAVSQGLPPVALIAKRTVDDHPELRQCAGRPSTGSKAFGELHASTWL